MKKPFLIACKHCEHYVPPPINDCMKHGDLGEMPGEVVKCQTFTNDLAHPNQFELKK